MLNKAGFTLIEVMVSLGLISLILVSALGLRNRNIRINNDAKNLTMATLLAHRSMVTITGYPEVGTESGEYETENFSWEKEVNYTILDPVREMRYSVSWKDYPEAPDTKTANFTMFFIEQ